MSGKKIDKNTMEKLEILSKISLDERERDDVMEELEKVLTYIDKLNELDTDGVEPLLDIVGTTNVFREDVIGNKNGKEDALKNAPAKKNDMFVVPKTL